MADGVGRAVELLPAGRQVPVGGVELDVGEGLGEVSVGEGDGDADVAVGDGVVVGEGDDVPVAAVAGSVCSVVLAAIGSAPVSRLLRTVNTTAPTTSTPMARTAQPAVAPGRRCRGGGAAVSSSGTARRVVAAVPVPSVLGSSRVRSYAPGAIPAVASSDPRPPATAVSCCRTSGRLGRSRGSLASIACRIGANVPARATGRGSSWATACTVDTGRSRRNGGWPSTAMYSVAARDHRSVAGLTSCPRTCSGET